jgi:hypothetical protein
MLRLYYHGGGEYGGTLCPGGADDCPGVDPSDGGGGGPGVGWDSGDIGEFTGFGSGICHGLRGVDASAAGAVGLAEYLGGAADCPGVGGGDCPAGGGGNALPMVNPTGDPRSDAPGTVAGAGALDR